MSSNVSVRRDTAAALHDIDRVDVSELSSNISLRREADAVPHGIVGA